MSNIPTVLICTHRRQEITTLNIKSLMRQSIVPHIVLVVSEPGEKEFYQSLEMDNLKVVVYPNRPLGSKFQHGVEVAMRTAPKFLIITGSDDILGKQFIEKADDLMNKGVDFIGLKQWFIYHKETLYLYDYMPTIPLGTRCYSLGLLRTLGGEIFDKNRDRLLDDKGFHRTIISGFSMYVDRDVLKSGLHVIAVKGDWPMMNTFEAMQNHPNCRLVRRFKTPSDFMNI